MRFNIMGIIFMMVAIWLGTMIGSSVAAMLGFAGGIIGAMVVGFMVYIVWALIAGQRINLMNGVIFAALVYIAQLIASMIFGATGWSGGLIGYFITALILSFLWGWIGRGSAKTSGIATGKGCRSRRRRR
ncbi:MAG: hypothetical protein DRN81_07425 [Thermoproteota archaeon]|nr:MAG: hypothetical protein DRN81_07425 [Candidatus Korarchaeota archaeon]